MHSSPYEKWGALLVPRRQDGAGGEEGLYCGHKEPPGAPWPPLLLALTPVWDGEWLAESWAGGTERGVRKGTSHLCWAQREEEPAKHLLFELWRPLRAVQRLPEPPAGPGRAQGSDTEGAPLQGAQVVWFWLQCRARGLWTPQRVLQLWHYWRREQPHKCLIPWCILSPFPGLLPIISPSELHGGIACFSNNVLMDFTYSHPSERGEWRGEFIYECCPRSSSQCSWICCQCGTKSPAPTSALLPISRCTDTATGALASFLLARPAPKEPELTGEEMRTSLPRGVQPQENLLRDREKARGNPKARGDKEHCG